MILKHELEFKKSLTLIAAPDTTVKLKGPDVAGLMKKYIGEMKAYMEGGSKKSAPIARAAVAAPAPTPPPSAGNQEMLRRYGANRSAPRPAPTAPPVVAVPVAPAAAPPTPAAIAAEITKLPTVVLAQGNWKGEADRYELTLQAQVSSLPFDDSKKSASV